MAPRDFNKEALSWDTPERIKLVEGIADIISREVVLAADTDVLDFGCGTGLLSLLLQPKVHSVTGVDTSKGMLDVFNAKIKTKAVSNIRTVLIAANEYTNIPGKYHFIVSSMTLHHVEDIGLFLRWAFSALLPAGRIVIVDLDPEQGLFHSNNEGVFHNGFDRHEFGSLLENAGFGQLHYFTAAKISKPVSGASPKDFTVFLVSGSKKKEVCYAAEK